MDDKVLRHHAICEELNTLYAKKNHDYGDSFHLSYCEEGMAMPRIRLSDKLNRFKTLSKNPDSQSVNDESIRDTLIDLANYAIMTILEMESTIEIENDNTRDRVQLLKYRGKDCGLTRADNGEFQLRECDCIICDICVYKDRQEGEYPCFKCCHGDGNMEYFKLDVRKVDIIK